MTNTAVAEPLKQSRWQRLGSNKYLTAAKASFYAGLFFATQYSLANTAPSKGISGGFSSATNIVKDIANGLYAIIGVVATIALVWQFALGFMNKKEWPDVLGTCLWILGAGAGLGFATYIFSQGTSIGSGFGK